MVDDDLLMQQVQEVLSRYPLQPVNGNLLELAGQNNGHLIRVIIPASFPDQNPEITLDGSKASYQYYNGMSIVECIGHAMNAPPAKTLPSPNNTESEHIHSDENRFMEDVQQIIIQHPEFQPVRGDLHFLQGSINSTAGFLTVTITIPQNYPYRPAQIMFNRDIGLGLAVSHDTIDPILVRAVDTIILKTMVQISQLPSMLRESATAYPSENRRPEDYVAGLYRPHPESPWQTPPAHRAEPTQSVPTQIQTRSPPLEQEKMPDLPPATILWGLYAVGLLLVGFSFFLMFNTFLLTGIVVIASAVAAYIDASVILSPKVTFGPGRVAICVLILWLIYFPYYILNRQGYFKQRFWDLHHAS